MEVNVEGDANQIYNKGIRKSDIYKEAVRFFGDTKHRKLVGTQAGVLLEIQKEAFAKDLEAHIFVVADAKASIKGRDVNLTLSRERNNLSR